MDISSLLHHAQQMLIEWMETYTHNATLQLYACCSLFIMRWLNKLNMTCWTILSV
jgi:hypothetical protein